LCWPIAVRGGVFLPSGSVLDCIACLAAFAFVFSFFLGFSFFLPVWVRVCIFPHLSSYSFGHLRWLSSFLSVIGQRKEMAFLIFGLVHPLNGFPF
jgi:hypothetical protein